MAAPRTVKELMTPEPKTLRRNDQLSVADELMKMERIRHLPVVDDEGEELVGIVSQRDLFRSALARALGYGERAQDRVIAMLVVKDVMTNDPVHVSPETPIPEAARILLEKRVGCLPVVQGGRLVGILSETDLLRLVAE